MKIISWNCNGKFREKFNIVKNFDADIYVIQECENPDFNKQKTYGEFASNFIWVGESPTKGLGIFAKPQIEIKNNNWDSSSLRYFLSVKVNDKFDLLGIWSMHPYTKTHYGYQAINIDKYNKDMVIVGDFNSNVIWDKKKSRCNHSSLNRNLNSIGLQSAYHVVNNELQGKESTATFFLYRMLEKQYHIDYCYLASDNLVHFAVGNYENWGKYSDHMPLFIETANIN